MDAIKNPILDLSIILNSILEDDHLVKKIEQITELLTDTYKKGNKVIFCGNGGSAAEAQHLAAELSGKFNFDRAPIPAEACHVNSSFITAVSNDFDFSKTYSRYIEGFGNKGDILIGMSTSGNSENIIHAFIKAKEKGITTIAFSGKTGGKLKKIADYNLNVPSENVPRIQEAHLLIGHIICEKVEKNLFK